MEELFNLVYCEGDILMTFVRLFILFLAVDFLFGFGYAIRSIRSSVA